MSRAEQVKLYRTFVKGLNTESSYLTYPEDSSSDELNTIPTRKGNRTRRFGIDYEDGAVIQTLTSQGDYFTEFVWKAVANQASVNFLCQHIGTNLWFFSLEADPVSDSLKPFHIDLIPYVAPGYTAQDIHVNNVEMSAGKGYLFVVHPRLEPLIVEYNKDTDTITVTKVIIQIRDFEGLNDGLANDQEPTTLTKEHQYNLMNQGWNPPSSQAAPGGITPTNNPVYYDPYTGSGYQYQRGFNIP